MILWLLDRYRELGFNKLLENIKTTPKVLSRHLDMLEEGKIILRDKFEKGKDRNCKLSLKTKWMITLGWQIEVRFKREGREVKVSYHFNGKSKTARGKIEKNTKVCFLLLFLAAMGTPNLKPVLEEVRPKLGDFYLTTPSKGDWPYRLYTIPGVSVRDFLLDYRDISSRWIFKYIRFSDEFEVEWYFNKLREFDPSIIKPLNEIDWIEPKIKDFKPSDESDGKTRYAITDEKLYRFLERCIVLLNVTIEAVELMLKYKRGSKLEQRNWYGFFYSKEYTNNLSKEPRDKQEDKLKNVDDLVKSYIIDAHTHYQILIGEKYKDIREKFDPVTNAFIDMAYPQFMLNLYKQTS